MVNKSSGHPTTWSSGHPVIHLHGQEVNIKLVIRVKKSSGHPPTWSINWHQVNKERPCEIFMYICNKIWKNSNNFGSRRFQDSIRPTIRAGLERRSFLVCKLFEFSHQKWPSLQRGSNGGSDAVLKPSNQSYLSFSKFYCIYTWKFHKGRFLNLLTWCQCIDHNL